MRISPTSTALAAVLTLTALTAAHPNINLLSPLASALSNSPLFALQSGFSQFNGLLSPATYTLLAGRLAILPARSASLLVPTQKAFAAAQLAASEADKATLNDAQACLTDILSRGSIPQGYACVDSGRNSLSRYRTAANTVLEQFVGIVPPSTLTLIQDDFTSYFSSLGLIPAINDINTHLQNVLASVTASISGETVTAVEKLQDCLGGAFAGSEGLQTDFRCFTAVDGPAEHLANILHGVLQQFAGYLPPNVVSDVINIYTFYLSTLPPASPLSPGTSSALDLMTHLNAALLSITASASGNTVTAVQQLAQCFNDVVMLEGDEAAQSAFECTVSKEGPVRTAQILVNGAVQQGFGYLPPSLVLQLEQELRPLLLTAPLPPSSSSAISTAFTAAFRSTDTGPEFATCLLALEDCVNAAVLKGSEVECALGEKCRPLVEA
ncbi:hypothetical protein JCM6882_004287 [Rhodosporidiobolus microsporus]